MDRNWPTLSLFHFLHYYIICNCIVSFMVTQSLSAVAVVIKGLQGVCGSKKQSGTAVANCIAIIRCTLLANIHPQPQSTMQSPGKKKKTAVWNILENKCQAKRIENSADCYTLRTYDKCSRCLNNPSKSTSKSSKITAKRHRETCFWMWKCTQRLVHTKMRVQKWVKNAFHF